MQGHICSSIDRCIMRFEKSLIVLHSDTYLSVFNVIYIILYSDGCNVTGKSVSVEDIFDLCLCFSIAVPL